MTTDAQIALAQVREALSAGPTPGPWYVRTNRHPTTDGRSWSWLDAAPPGGPQRSIAGVRVDWEGGDTSAVNARYLAACSPANIAAILAHVEAQAAEIERLRAERAELRDVLLRNGFVPCDIPACNCGSWHHRYGLPERMQEIKDALAEAGHELSNANGNLTLNALKALVAERDELRRQLDECSQMLARQAATIRDLTRPAGPRG